MKKKLTTMSYKKFVIAAILTLVFSQTFAHTNAIENSANEQNQAYKSTPIEISGQVLDSNSEPMIGVCVIVNNTSIGNVTDGDGKFNFTANKLRLPFAINIQLLGYKDVTILVEEESEAQNLEITMREDVGNLDDVVVIGYGTSSRRKLVGSVAKIDSKIIESATQDSPIAALQGTAAGVYIQQGSGVPGGGSTSILIRGKNTMTGNTEPLYIIDGIPFNTSSINPVGVATTGVFGLPDALSFISPNDIESIEILKDADATAIYGTRGANGVVLVTTKKGKKGKASVHITYSNTTSVTPQRLDLLNTKDYVKLRREAYEADLARGDVKESDFNENNYPDLFIWDQEKDYDWQEQLMGGVSNNHDAQITVSGGSDNTSYLVSGTYYNATSTLMSKDKYNRWNAKASLSHKSSDNKFAVDASMTISQIGMEGNASQSPYRDITQAPNRPLLDDEGRPYYIPDNPDDNSPTDFLAFLGETTTRTTLANANMEYEFFQGFRGKISANYTTGFSDQSRKYELYYENPYEPEYFYNESYLYLSNNQIINLEPQLNYIKRIGYHKLSGLLGATYQNSTSKYLRVDLDHFLDDVFMDDASSAGNIDYVTTPYYQSKKASLFGRVSYDYGDRYLANIIYRRDGSSKFGRDNRWANFYSVGGAWIFSNERFLKDNGTDALSFGKIRFSYGKTGSDGVSDYAYVSKYTVGNNQYDGKVGMYPDNLGNESLAWETTNKLDVGLELGFLNDRIFVNSTYYHNISSNLLRNVPLPSQSGFDSYSGNIDAKIQNSGFEFDINTVNIQKKNFKWTTNFNITAPKNKLLHYKDLEKTTYYDDYVIGESIDVIFGYKYLGINPENGHAMLEDVNKDGEYSSKYDYQVLGDEDPDFYGGLTNNLQYKNFTLDFTFYFRKKEHQQGYFWFFDDPAGCSQNVTYDILENSWRKPGDIAKYPGITSTTDSKIADSMWRAGYSDFAYSNASYIRLQNVSLAYNVPQDALSKINVKALKLYVNAKNLFTITNYDSFDPETGINSVPLARSIIFGINLTL